MVIFAIIASYLEESVEKKTFKTQKTSDQAYS